MKLSQQASSIGRRALLQKPAGPRGRTDVSACVYRKLIRSTRFIAINQCFPACEASERIIQHVEMIRLLQGTDVPPAVWRKLPAFPKFAGSDVFAADCQHSHLVAGFPALCRGGQDLLREARKCATSWRRFCLNRAERRKLLVLSFPSQARRRYCRPAGEKAGLHGGIDRPFVPLRRRRERERKSA